MTSPEEADWQLSLSNMRNSISGMAPETVEVEVVAYGPGTGARERHTVCGAYLARSFAHDSKRSHRKSEWLDPRKRGKAVLRSALCRVGNLLPGFPGGDAVSISGTRCGQKC